MGSPPALNPGGIIGPAAAFTGTRPGMAAMPPAGKGSWGMPLTGWTME